MKHKIENISEFKDIVKNSRSISQVADKLGYKRRPNGKLSGGIFRFLKNKISELKIDTSHMNGRGWAKGLSRITDSSLNEMALKLESEDIFTIGSISKNDVLIRKLLSEGEPYECSECGLNQWKDKPLRLQLDHKNGDSSDNRRKNLRLLCPNCHTQTPTYSRGKIKKSKIMWWEKIPLK